MGDTLKVLGQIDVAATTEEPLYTVPDTAMTTTSSLVICNRTASVIDFRISVSVAGAATANKDYLFYDTPIAANTMVSAVLGLTLGPGDIVRTYSSATGLSINLFGVETS